MLILPFPIIDPVLIQLGPLKVHWYGIAYIAGIVGGWHYALWLAKRYTNVITKQNIDDYITLAVISIVLGGRLGHILFYDFFYYLHHPLEILMTWKGGMSFHGGFMGIVISTIVFCRKRKIPLFAFADILAAVAPLGLFFGRLANFINGELYGRVTDVPWAMIFPYAGPLPRHPSQLYEAALEGLALLIILYWGWTKTSLSKTPGRLTGLFMLGYGISRILIEFVREPEPGLFYSGITIGQVLSLPLLILGLYWFSLRKDA